MAAADPREAPTTDRTPGLTTTGAAASGPREVGREASRASLSPNSDTLLSAPTPATREDFAFDERLSEAERRVAELLLRVEHLERAAGRPSQNRPPRALWFWFVFLAGLALAWQILSRFR
ncbi:MAG TPA: hypothetical protein VFQ61_09615 [Polyangiaceae bacterium]|nr:hypothetical protein [Polyangiaceae bacterium]